MNRLRWFFFYSKARSWSRVFLLKLNCHLKIHVFTLTFGGTVCVKNLIPISRRCVCIENDHCLKKNVSNVRENIKLNHFPLACFAIVLSILSSHAFSLSCCTVPNIKSDTVIAPKISIRSYCLNIKIVCTNVWHFNHVDIYIAECTKGIKLFW